MLSNACYHMKYILKKENTNNKPNVLPMQYVSRLRNVKNRKWFNIFVKQQSYNHCIKSFDSFWKKEDRPLYLKIYLFRENDGN